MITVAILINGQPIMARSAWNVGVMEDGRCEYAVDDGSVIHHLRSASQKPGGASGVGSAGVGDTSATGARP